MTKSIIDRKVHTIMRIPTKAVVPVAGLGTRSRPFSSFVPKELLPVVYTPTLQFIVEELAASGIEELVLVIGLHKNSLVEFVEKVILDKPMKISTVVQDPPLGLGHAILQAKERLQGDSFMVCLGDEVFKSDTVPATKQLIDIAMAEQVSAVAVKSVPADKLQFHGVVDVGGKSLLAAPARVKGAVEKPASSKTAVNYGIIGRYVFGPEIFSVLEEVGVGAGGEIQLTDALNLLSQGAGLCAAQLDCSHYDMGQPSGYIKAQIDWALGDALLRSEITDYLKDRL